MDIETLILTIVKQHGLKAIFSILGSAITYMVAKLLFKWLQERMKYHQRKETIKQSSLYNHAIFRKLQLYSSSYYW